MELVDVVDIMVIPDVVHVEPSSWYRSTTGHPDASVCIEPDVGFVTLNVTVGDDAKLAEFDQSNPVPVSSRGLLTSMNSCNVPLGADDIVDGRWLSSLTTSHSVVVVAGAVEDGVTWIFVMPP